MSSPSVSRNARRTASGTVVRPLLISLLLIIASSAESVPHCDGSAHFRPCSRYSLHPPSLFGGALPTADGKAVCLGYFGSASAATRSRRLPSDDPGKG